MSLLYLHFESDERDGRVQKLARSGAHVIVSEPKWPGFWEIAKRERPAAIAVDFTHAPSHALETADYIAKARETRETPIYLLHVPEDRMEMVQKRLPQAGVVTEAELAEKLTEIERQAAARAQERKEAAAEARRTAAAAKRAARNAAQGKNAPAGTPSKSVSKSAVAGKGVPKKTKTGGAKPAVMAARANASRKKVAGPAKKPGVSRKKPAQKKKK
jgi:type IV secretory pathway VirB10-like protein